MKLHLLITLMLMFTLNIAHSQINTNSGNEIDVTKKLSLEEELEGTYEVIITNSKIKEAFTTDLLNTIEAKREENRDIMYVMSQYTSIRIFSREKINSLEFKNKKK